MQPIKSITIPQPCHENWTHMTPVDQGRHCMQCSKTVIDFTAMTNLEIINYFAGTGNVCGRFGETQLDGLNNYLAVEEKPRFSWKKLAIAAAVASLFATANANAQRTVGKVAVLQPTKSPKTTFVGDTLTYSTIKGKIIAEDDNSVLPGVTVRVKGMAIGTQTNANGEFSLDVPATTQSLLVSLIGYQSYEASISDFAKESNCVSLKMRSNVLGGAIVVVRVKKAPFYKVWWYKIKHIF